MCSLYLISVKSHNKLQEKVATIKRTRKGPDYLITPAVSDLLCWRVLQRMIYLAYLKWCPQRNMNPSESCTVIWKGFINHELLKGVSIGIIRYFVCHILWQLYIYAGWRVKKKQFNSCNILNYILIFVLKTIPVKQFLQQFKMYIPTCLFMITPLLIGT